MHPNLNRTVNRNWSTVGTLYDVEHLDMARRSAVESPMSLPMSERAAVSSHIAIMIRRMSSTAMVGRAAKSIVVCEVVVRGLIDVMNLAHIT